MWATEKNRKQELEKILAETIKEVEQIKNRNNEHMKQIKLVRENIPLLEEKLAESSEEIDVLKDKMNTAVELLISFKDKRDQMREEYLSMFRELRNVQNKVNGHALSLNDLPTLTSSFSEISDATQNFNPARKLGEGRNGSVYLGLLGHVVVAIKMLPDCGSKDNLKFTQEVNICLTLFSKINDGPRKQI